MLGPTIAAHLPVLREGAQSMQTDRCVIERPGTGDGVFDPATGTTTPPAPTVLYRGPCRIRVPDLADQPKNAGEHDFTVQQSILSIPVTVTGVRVDDEVLITASTHDPDLPGRRFVIGAAGRGSQLTARRFVISEVTS